MKAGGARVRTQVRPAHAPPLAIRRPPGGRADRRPPRLLLRRMAADQPRAALALQLLQAELTPGRAPAVGRCDAAPAPAAPPLAHRACRPSRPRRGVGRPPTAACTRDGRGAHAAEHRRVQRARRMVRREPRCACVCACDGWTCSTVASGSASPRALHLNGLAARPPACSQHTATHALSSRLRTRFSSTMPYHTH
eukprot:5127430-Pleurochrysis_carterae.AAC.2